MQKTRLSDFAPLSPAEERIIAELGHGDFDRLGDGLVPAEPDPTRYVRAELLRFILVGGDEASRPHEKGIRVSGGWIGGTLDLEGCRIPHDIRLKDCFLEAVPNLRSAIIDNLFLDGSVLPGLQADRIEARGGFHLRGATITGEMSLSSSRLGGSFECDSATINCPDQWAIIAEGLTARSLFLRGATVNGGINIAGARLGADLDFTGATISRPAGVAIHAETLDAGGGVILRGATVAGETRLLGARLDGDLDATGAKLKQPGDFALLVNRATVRGGFFLCKDAAVDGVLDLTGASFDTIHDDEACWPAKTNLLLNRCLYNAFIGGPVDAVRRLDWLSRQEPARWGEDFWPQPFEQLAQVFREMGHDEDARTVLIAKERLQRRARRQRTSNRLWRQALSVKDGILGITVGYGRQPLRSFVWLFLFWAIGVGVFGFADAHSALKPNSPVILRSPEWTMCGLPLGEQVFMPATEQWAKGRAAEGQSQLDCFRSQREALSYQAFNAWMYSLDTLFPVLEVGQKQFWRPDTTKKWGSLVMAYFYFQAVVGWALSLLAIAGFSGLVKSK
ncbi:hypothetical protein [Nordella sp. HKS 07]|uniref:hypothetical protein n=1 Tax=Nordella sp. HKS 07 TaxID=2712222 RepID=UPI001FEEE6D1|nr:hypothetical protein [Nordella sp. HKS 07]